MDALWIALAGVALGGLFTLAGAWVQGRLALRVASRQAALAALHQREMLLLHNRIAAYSQLLRLVATLYVHDDDARPRFAATASQIRVHTMSHRTSLGEHTHEWGWLLAETLDQAQEGRHEASRSIWAELSNFNDHLHGELATLTRADLSTI